MKKGVQISISGKPDNNTMVSRKRGRPKGSGIKKAGPGRNKLNPLLVRKSQYTVKLNLAEVAIAHGLMKIMKVKTVPELFQSLLQNEAVRHKADLSKFPKGE